MISVTPMPMAKERELSLVLGVVSGMALVFGLRQKKTGTTTKGWCRSEGSDDSDILAQRSRRCFYYSILLQHVTEDFRQRSTHGADVFMPVVLLQDLPILQ